MNFGFKENEMRRKVIDYLDKLPKLVKNTYNMAGLVRKLGFASSQSMYQTLQKYIDNLKLDTSHWIKYKKQNPGLNKNPTNEELFIENCPYSSRFVKTRICKLISYECSICGISEWNNKPIALQLDHINGIRNDNRLENLRLLCPNCHTQTETWGVKNSKRPALIKNACKVCGKKIGKTSMYCIKHISQFRCQYKQPTKIAWPPIEELLEMLEGSSYVAVGKKLGVSDNAIRKHIRHIYRD
jgi:5-methylcytosine-specific restriction endonuclease McrA